MGIYCAYGGPGADAWPSLRGPDRSVASPPQIGRPENAAHPPRPYGLCLSLQVRLRLAHSELSGSDRMLIAFYNTQSSSSAPIRLSRNVTRAYLRVLGPSWQWRRAVGPQT